MRETHRWIGDRALNQVRFSHPTNTGTVTNDETPSLMPFGGLTRVTADVSHADDHCQPDRAVVALSFDGEGRTRKFVLRKIGNEWKFDDLILSGED